MPNLQNNDLALLLRELSQGTHGGPFGLGFCRGLFKPAVRFQFASQAAPQTPSIVQGTVAEAAQAIMLRLFGRRFKLHERHKRLLNNVFSFSMAQPEGAAIEDELSGFCLIQLFAPSGLFFAIHRFNQFSG